MSFGGGGERKRKYGLWDERVPLQLWLLWPVHWVRWCQSSVPLPEGLPAELKNAVLQSSQFLFFRLRQRLRLHVALARSADCLHHALSHCHRADPPLHDTTSDEEWCHGAAPADGRRRSDHHRQSRKCWCSSRLSDGPAAGLLTQQCLQCQLPPANATADSNSTSNSATNSAAKLGSKLLTRRRNCDCHF